MNQEEIKLRKLYSQILKGYTKGKFRGQDLFIRHFSSINQGEIDDEYLTIFDKCIENGMPTYEEKLKYLKDFELWSEQEEKDLESLISYKNGLLESKKNLLYTSQLNEAAARIKETEDKMFILEKRKNELIGTTAERFTENRINEIYIYNNLFKDSNLSISFFSEEEIDDLDKEDGREMIETYDKCMSDFDLRNIKKISLADFFQLAFRLCDDKFFDFFGRPIGFLSFFQLRLGEYGKYFKHILSGENPPPEEFARDPDKLLGWFEGRQRANKALGSEEGAISLIGATPEDVKLIAKESGAEAVSFAQIAKEQGKTRLSGADLKKLLMK